MKLNEGLETLGIIDSQGLYGVFEKSALKNLQLSSTLRNIGCSAFQDCKAMRHIRLPDRLESIGERCFRGCRFREIMIPRTVQSIGEDAFADSALMWVNVEDGC